MVALARLTVYLSLPSARPCPNARRGAFCERSMTEAQARKLCTERGRDPDRDMTGPDGPMKAWEMYDNPPAWREGRIDDAPTSPRQDKCPHSE